MQLAQLRDRRQDLHLGEVEPRHYVKWIEHSNGRPPRMNSYGHSLLSFRFPDVDDDPQTRDLSNIDTLYPGIRNQYADPSSVPQDDTAAGLSEFTVSSDRNDRAFGCMRATRRGPSPRPSPPRTARGLV